MEVLMQLTLPLSALVTVITYLNFLKQIRNNIDRIDVNIDNFFVLNFLSVYKSYIRTRKLDNLNIGVMFYVHFIFLFIMIILAYLLDGKQVFII